MSWLFPRVYDRLIAATEAACLQAWRAELLAGASGEVLEIGAGTGANLAHYGAGVTRLVLTEPEPAMLDRLRPRIGGGEVRPERVEVVEAGGTDLPFEDATFDVVVSTLVLCSVPDQAVALGEVRRVLRPGGRLLFIEHVAAEDRPARLRWQRRVEPVWRRLAGNCHLTRRTGDAIADAGFEVEVLTREGLRKTVSVARPSVRGTARRPVEGPDAVEVSPRG